MGHLWKILLGGAFVPALRFTLHSEFFALYHADSKHFRNRLHRYVLEHVED